MYKQILEIACVTKKRWSDPNRYLALKCLKRYLLTNYPQHFCQAISLSPTLRSWLPNTVTGIKNVAPVRFFTGPTQNPFAQKKAGTISSFHKAFVLQVFLAANVSHHTRGLTYWGSDFSHHISGTFWNFDWLSVSLFPFALVFSLSNPDPTTSTTLGFHGLPFSRCSALAQSDIQATEVTLLYPQSSQSSQAAAREARFCMEDQVSSDTHGGK